MPTKRHYSQIEFRLMTKPEQVHFYSNYATRAACMHARLKAAAAAAAPLAAIRWLVATRCTYILLLWLTATASTTVQCCRQDWVVVGKS